MGFEDAPAPDMDLDDVPGAHDMDGIVPDNAKKEEIYFSGEESDFEEQEEVHQQKKLGHRKVSFERSESPEIVHGIFSLPPELWLEIFSYIDPKLLSTVLVTLCKAFHYFLTSEEYWELRLRYNVGSTITTKQHETFLLRGLPYVCHAMEKSRALFKTGAGLTKRLASHAGDVHCVKILKKYNLGLSGSRDKTIQVYDLKRGENNELKQDLLVKTDSSHNGWVWCLAQEAHSSSKLMSGSWDGFAHVYDVGQDMSLIDRIEVGSAVLCGVFEPSIVMYGTYSKYIGGYDTRSGKREMKITTSHNRPILSLASSEHYIWSTGEDHALSCHDRRAGRLFKRIKLQRISTAIDYCAPYLWFGGYDGSIKCYNSEMKSVKRFDTDHTGPITALKHTLGATFTSSKDCTVKVYSPSIQPVEWQTLRLDGEVSCTDYSDGVVMAGDCNMSVTFWYQE